MTAVVGYAQSRLESAAVMHVIPGVDKLISFQRAFFAVLATAQSRPWGTIWANHENPKSHDSNHADLEVLLLPERLPEVLSEVAEWYGTRSLQPRLRFYMPPNDAKLIRVAEGLGWRSACHEQTFRAWPATADRGELWEVPGLTLGPVAPEQLEDLLVVNNEGADDETAFRHRQVWAALAWDRNTDCLLARIEREPAASLACVWSEGWGNVGDVATRERFRRRGICRAMLCYAQELAIKRKESGLHLYHVEEGPGRIYAAVGFQLVATVRQASLWLEG
jgi:hypothetical protein